MLSRRMDHAVVAVVERRSGRPRSRSAATATETVVGSADG